MLGRWWFRLGLLSLGMTLLGVLLVVFAALVTIPTLPSLDSLTDYRPKVPLRIYSADGLLIGEFGEERRSIIKIEAVPERLKQAILAAEDDRFYEHSGVDYIGVLRAIYSNLVSRGMGQGASTITMQVARNFFLTKEKTLTRKFSETLLAFKIEQSLSKNQILELYINQIYLGQRTYGFASAAQTYFGKPLTQISIAEAAMLAGLPKAPSRFNPVVNPQRARTRQMYILRRMNELGHITKEELSKAGEEKLAVKRAIQEFSINAGHVAEMVRQVVWERYKEETYTKGIKVYTTIKRLDQDAAYKALRQSVLDYDRRHGYRGPEGYVDLSRFDTTHEESLEDALTDIADSDELHVALVLAADTRLVRVYRKGGGMIDIKGDGLRFAQKSLTADKTAPGPQRIRPGSLIRIQKHPGNGTWQIVQLPQVEASFISMNAQNGAILSLVGGFDFYRNQFNHVTQAWRQPGSSFKPFIYSASLDKGLTPASVIDDAPLTIDAAQTGNEVWEPKNFDNQFSGPLRMREALAKSRNLVSIRILQSIGVQYAQDYIARFGFDPKHHPPYLSMALGAGTATPMQMAVGYSVFANGGFRVTPYLIERIEDEKGQIIKQANPATAGGKAKQIIDPRNAFLMTSMMQDVIQYGTATKAKILGRGDLAGKTGTTNEHVDAWFCGYQDNLVGIAWIGFDTPKPLGNNETGGQAALPMWISYMGKILRGVPVIPYSPPAGIVTTRIDAATGLSDPDGTLTEYFLAEQLPAAAEKKAGETEHTGDSSIVEDVTKTLDDLMEKLLNP